jgi:phosphatidylinositol alpha-mannosyltransferase
MRIAQVCPYSLSMPGGVQSQVLGLARAQRRAGHEVTVLGPSDGPPPEPGVRTLGRSVPLPANGSVAPIAPDVACALRTIAALRDGRFDLLHLHEPMVPGPTLTALLYSDLPVVATFHRSGASSAYASFAGLLVRWARRIDIRCAVSSAARETAQGALGGTYRMLYNAVDLAPFDQAQKLDTDGPTLFFIGRHEERKGLAVLLEAVSLLPTAPRLWVASDGPQTLDLQRRFSGLANLEWLGRISDQERAWRMKSADLVCVPSLGGESFGLVLLEAMAAGAALVASDIDGYRGVATHERNALLVPPGDPAAWAAALERMMDDPDLRQGLAASGRSRAEEMSMDHLAQDYCQLYQELPRGSRGRTQAAPV